MDYPLPRNIFLAGKMGAGKDYVAARLCEDAGFTRLAFADALKREVAEDAGITVEELNRRKAEFRPRLQWWGVNKRETVSPDYWVNRWEGARALISGPVVVTDARFLNEALYGFKIGALVVIVDTPESVRIERLLARDGNFDPATLTHSSELGIDTMPCHLKVSGEEPACVYVPMLSAGYTTLLGLRRAA